MKLRLGEKSTEIEFNDSEVWFLKKIVENYISKYPDETIMPNEIEKIYEQVVRAEAYLKELK